MRDKVRNCGRWCRIAYYEINIHAPLAPNKYDRPNKPNHSAFLDPSPTLHTSTDPNILTFQGRLIERTQAHVTGGKIQIVKTSICLPFPMQHLHPLHPESQTPGPQHFESQARPTYTTLFYDDSPIKPSYSCTITLYTEVRLALIRIWEYLAGNRRWRRPP